MSPGNLYRYFRSKEDIIAGIAERDRAETAQNFAAVSAGNFFDGLAALAQHHLVERSLEEVALCAEIMAESRRNPAVARIYQDMEADVRARFIDIAASARPSAVRSAATSTSNGTVTVLFALADGLSWRRAVEPSFNAEAVMPIVLRMVEQLLAVRRAQRQQDRGTVMKGARIAAVGLVVGAAAWIASGHLFPHETAESRAAVQSGRGGAAEVVPRLRVEVARRAAPPKPRALRPHRGRQEDDAHGPRRRHHYGTEGAARLGRQARRCDRHSVRRGARSPRRCRHARC